MARSSLRPARRKNTDSAENRSIAGVALTNPDRVLYPDQGINKRQLAEYYESVADAILPEVADRPLTLVRCPQGRQGQCFYQKHWKDSLPEAVGHVEIQEKSGRDKYVAIHDLPGLVSLVQMNVLELHPWGSRTDKLESPDRMIFDLDPGDGVPWSDVKSAALEVRQRLSDLKLESWVKTTGGKGLHVVVPLRRRNSWEEVRRFAEDFAVLMAGDQPERYVANMRKQLRRGKIYVDYLRNQRGATAIASYSTRRHPGAPVATPVAWEELDKLKSAAAFTIDNVPERLRRRTADPWEGFYASPQSLTKQAQKEVARRDR